MSDLTAKNSAAVSLYDLIDFGTSFVSNSLNDLKNLFMGGHTLPLVSDADEQIILQFSFREFVRIDELVFTVPPTDQCPKTIKLFVNRTNMSFDTCEEDKPTLVHTVDSSVASVATTATSATVFSTTSNNNNKQIKINLNPLIFGKSTALTIFIEDNFGNDVTTLYSLAIKGSANNASMNMNDFSKKPS